MSIGLVLQTSGAVSVSYTLDACSILGLVSLAVAGLGAGYLIRSAPAWYDASAQGASAQEAIGSGGLNVVDEAEHIEAQGILAVDVGGTHVKVKCSSGDTVLRAVSGPELTAGAMVTVVKDMTRDWDFDRISIGYPGPVLHGCIAREPYNLGPGWMELDFTEAFGKPVKIINDAAMQALGSYSGGRMLFLGLGTGFGSVLILDGVVQPLELAHLPYRKGRTYEDYAGLKGQERLGKKRWRKAVTRIIEELSTALEPEYVVIGGGEAKKLKSLPPNCRLGTNAAAFDGGFKIWHGGGS